MALRSFFVWRCSVTIYPRAVDFDGVAYETRSVDGRLQNLAHLVEKARRPLYLADEPARRLHWLAMIGSLEGGNPHGKTMTLDRG